MNSPRAGSEEEVSDEEFRQLMSLVCGPVVVVTTMSEGEPAGTTISAFASLSAQPRMIMLALDQTSRLLGKIGATERFGVNILGVGQEELAARFATKRDDKFDGVGWTACAGLPRLSGTSGWASCKTERFVPGGDHIIVIGEVDSVSSDDSDRPPLVYGRRTFGAHSGLVTGG